MVSVVVPIYRVEKYLRKCVDSLLQQTYKNIEIILVDDGSPDACPEICDELKETDDRIVVIHKKNGGLSDARNAGIQIANGTYITFIDSDDYVGIHYIETLVKAIEDGKASVSICDYNNVYDDMGMEEKKAFVISSVIRSVSKKFTIQFVMEWSLLRGGNYTKQVCLRIMRFCTL